MGKDICVVMATYNGIRFLREQLDSIRDQTLKPDTVFIIDDCSADGTPEFIDSYIKEHDLDNWKFLKHAQNQGFVKTFFEAISATTERYIFLADQDDVWNETKIEKMYNQIVKNPKCLVLCSDFYPIYEEGSSPVRLIPYSYKIEAGMRKLIPFRKYLYRGIRPGCGYCVDRRLVRFFPEYEVEGEYHDAFFFRLANLLDGLYIFPEATIGWRRHAHNTSSSIIPDYIIKQHELDVLKRDLIFFDKECIQNQRRRRQIIKCINLFSLRAAYYMKPRLLIWIKMIPYFRYFENPLGIFWDFHWLFVTSCDRVGA